MGKWNIIFQSGIDSMSIFHYESHSSQKHITNSSLEDATVSSGFEHPTGMPSREAEAPKSRPAPVAPAPGQEEGRQADRGKRVWQIGTWGFNVIYS